MIVTIMNVFHVLNRFLASTGGVLLVVYEFLRIYKSDINPIYDNLYMLDNPYVPFSSFMLLSLTYLFLNMFSFSKNSMSNNLRGNYSKFTWNKNVNQKVGYNPWVNNFFCVYTIL
ncbi:hypothetical protein MKS88_003156 [Plasmodium brasilianum]|uniref:Uncharacterized protein n=1 Tax=Plasmodium brasilianum TaxID=5824 RepID=A0ACB9Y8S5_PLABR|nr:hypothetical protein MKS88_003156 [Plasmodium brasilianum]